MKFIIRKILLVKHIKQNNLRFNSERISHHTLIEGRFSGMFNKEIFQSLIFRKKKSHLANYYLRILLDIPYQ
jgi:hypothetical protein